MTDRQRENRRIKRMEQATYRRIMGICIVCGKVPARKGYTTCFACARRQSEYYYRKKERKS